MNPQRLFLSSPPLRLLLPFSARDAALPRIGPASLSFSPSPLYPPSFSPSPPSSVRSRLALPHALLPRGFRFVWDRRSENTTDRTETILTLTYNNNQHLQPHRSALGLQSFFPIVCLVQRPQPKFPIYSHRSFMHHPIGKSTCVSSTTRCSVALLGCWVGCLRLFPFCRAMTQDEETRCATTRREGREEIPNRQPRPPVPRTRVSANLCTTLPGSLQLHLLDFQHPTPSNDTSSTITTACKPLIRILRSPRPSPHLGFDTTAATEHPTVLLSSTAPPNRSFANRSFSASKSKNFPSGIRDSGFLGFQVLDFFVPKCDWPRR